MKYTVETDNLGLSFLKNKSTQELIPILASELEFWQRIKKLEEAMTEIRDTENWDHSISCARCKTLAEEALKDE